MALAVRLRHLKARRLQAGQQSLASKLVGAGAVPAVGESGEEGRGGVKCVISVLNCWQLKKDSVDNIAEISLER